MKENVLIYKATEKVYCDSLNLEKTYKKPSKKRDAKKDILQPGSEPGHGESCIECGVEIPTGKSNMIRTFFNILTMTNILI